MSLPVEPSRTDMLRSILGNWAGQDPAAAVQFLDRLPADVGRDNLMELSASRVIITDIDNNRFEFPDINKLDGRSQGIIMRNL